MTSKPFKARNQMERPRKQVRKLCVFGSVYVWMREISTEHGVQCKLSGCGFVGVSCHVASCEASRLDALRINQKAKQFLIMPHHRDSTP